MLSIQYSNFHPTTADGIREWLGVGTFTSTTANWQHGEGIREYVIDFSQFAVADYHLDAFADEDEDFWKVGGRLGWIVGAGFGIHPV